MLSIRLSKFKSKFYKKSGGFVTQHNKDPHNSNISNYSSRSPNVFNSSRRSDEDRADDQATMIDRRLKCYEYEGFGHYQAKCSTYLKWMKNGFTATLSNDDSSSGSV